MKFKSISVKEWRQFRDVEINLHPRLTILTGPNGSGKSTLISLLSLSIRIDHREPFLATPVNDESSGLTRFSIGTLFSRFNPFRHAQEVEPSAEHHKIGTVSYSTGDTADLFIHNQKTLQYQVQMSNAKPINGFKIDSHRSMPRYQHIKSLPISGVSPKQAFHYFTQSQASYHRSSRLQRDGQFIDNPIAPLKETLIGFAAFGADSKHMRAIPELVGLYDKFQNILRKVLPVEIGFQHLEVRSPEIVVVSRTGEFPIDSASGGLMSLIQTAWQIFLFTEANGTDAVVLIDEPENHLHPSLQRAFLSNLVQTFEHVQFIVATHSPFIISSVKDSKIYALKYSALDGKEQESSLAITSHHVDIKSRASSAPKILDEVLGVSVTIPVWAEDELERIARQFETSNLTQQSIEQLRTELQQSNLSEFFPEALGRIVRD